MKMGREHAKMILMHAARTSKFWEQTEEQIEAYLDEEYGPKNTEEKSNEQSENKNENSAKDKERK